MIDVKKLRKLKGRRIYLFWLDEKTGDITDVTSRDDVVHVIKCKDCKHKYIEDKVWRCPFGLPGGPDFWCGYGAERKEE